MGAKRRNFPHFLEIQRKIAASFLQNANRAEFLDKICRFSRISNVSLDFQKKCVLSTMLSIRVVTRTAPPSMYDTLSSSQNLLEAFLKIHGYFERKSTRFTCILWRCPCRSVLEPHLVVIAHNLCRNPAKQPKPGENVGAQHGAHYKSGAQQVWLHFLEYLGQIVATSTKPNCKIDFPKRGRILQEERARASRRSLPPPVTASKAFWASRKGRF